MLSVDTFKSKFQTVKRESGDIRNAYQAMDNYANGAEKTSIDGSSTHSWKSLNSLLSGSLISTDVPSKAEESDVRPNRTPYDSNTVLICKTDDEHVQEIVEMLSIKKRLLGDPVLREVLQKCENMLMETKAKMRPGFPELVLPDGPSQIDDFEVVRKDQIFHTSSVNLPESQIKSQKKFFLSNFLKNFAESRRYKKLGRDESYSSGDLRTLGQQANIGRSFEARNGPTISSALDCPKNDHFNQKPSCAVLGVLNVCEHCNQPIEEPLVDDQFSTPPCIVCQESFPQSEMEFHLRKHSSIEELNCVK